MQIFVCLLHGSRRSEEDVRRKLMELGWVDLDARANSVMDITAEELDERYGFSADGIALFMEVRESICTARKTITLAVVPGDTIWAVKLKVEAREGIPAAEQRLVWRARALQDDATLQDYQIGDDETLHQVERLRGD